MSSNAKTQRVHWSNRLAFVLVAAGSAIGLGNLWKFPYIAGVNGGGAFVLVYLLCIAAVGVPIFIAELYIGQTSQKNAVHAFEAVHKKGTPWRSIGGMGVLCAFLILSFYNVVGGWVFDYTLRSIVDPFSGHTDEEIKGFLGSLFANPGRQLLFHFIFMIITTAIVACGIKEGLERWNKILMPALMGLLVFLLVRSFTLDGFGQAIGFLFSFDTSKLTNAGILEAVGHSFFTLSLGMAAMITFGSYLQKRESLVRMAFTVSLMDTAIALVAGVVIFSIVFSYGLEPGGGPTLMFQTLPVLFSKLTGGYAVSVAFFMLVSFAALTSAISLYEVIVTYAVEKYGASRKKTTLIAGSLIYALGILSALSTNVLSDFKIIGLTFFDLFDKMTSNLIMPLGGLLTALFFGWVLGPKAIKSALGKNIPAALHPAFLWTVRLIAPVAVAYVLFKGLSDW